MKYLTFPVPCHSQKCSGFRVLRAPHPECPRSSENGRARGVSGEGKCLGRAVPRLVWDEEEERSPQQPGLGRAKAGADEEEERSPQQPGLGQARLARSLPPAPRAWDGAAVPIVKSCEMKWRLSLWKSPDSHRKKEKQKISLLPHAWLGPVTIYTRFLSSPPCGRGRHQPFYALIQIKGCLIFVFPSSVLSTADIYTSLHYYKKGKKLPRIHLYCIEENVLKKPQPPHPASVPPSLPQVEILGPCNIKFGLLFGFLFK